MVVPGILNQTFNPGAHQWHPMPQGNYDNMMRNLHEDRVSEFLHAHPNFIPLLFKKKEQHDRLEFVRFYTDYGIRDLLGVMCEMIKAMQPSFASAVDSIKSKLALIDQHNSDFQTLPNDYVSDKIEISGEHFLQEMMSRITSSVQANHNIALSEGYAHANNPNPEQATAYTSPWGVTHKQGNDWQFQPHVQDPYGPQNNGYPNQTPHGMHNPHHQRGGLMTSLLAMGLMGASGA